MSKERELLKKIWEDLDGDRDNYNLLCEEIEELLAQPDALAQVIEVRDIQGRDGNFDQDDYMRGIYNGLELAVSIFEDREPSYKELLAQPEQTEQTPVAWMYDYISPTSVKHTSVEFGKCPSEEWMTNIRPLYTALPKREPLNCCEITYPEWVFTRERQQAFDAGVRFAEKAHGIGGGDENDTQHTN